MLPAAPSRADPSRWMEGGWLRILGVHRQIRPTTLLGSLLLPPSHTITPQLRHRSCQVWWLAVRRNLHHANCCVALPSPCQYAPRMHIFTHSHTPTDAEWPTKTNLSLERRLRCHYKFIAFLIYHAYCSPGSGLICLSKQLDNLSSICN